VHFICSIHVFITSYLLHVSVFVPLWNLDRYGNSHLFLFQPSALHMFNTCIYRQLPTKYFGVCYTIFRETTSLFLCYTFYGSRHNSVCIETRYWSGDRIPVEAKISAPVQIGPGAHPFSYTMDTWSFSEVKRPERGVDHPPHLAPRLKKE